MKPFYEKTISLDTINHILYTFKQKIYTPVTNLNIEFAKTKEPVPFDQKDALTYRPIQIGDVWGELWDCAWFHFTFHDKLPDQVMGKKLVLRLDIGGEGCLFDAEGTPIRGITNVSSTFETSLGTPGKRVIQWTPKYCGNEQVDLWVDAGCNDLFGTYVGKGKIVQAEIAICDEKLREIYYDFWVLNDLVKVLDPDTARYSALCIALNQVAQMLCEPDMPRLDEAAQILKKQLSLKSGDTALTFTATGHAHLDLAWLWPIRETKRKAARTFATVIELLDRYPYYIFGASQPQQFAWIKENYPKLFEKIKQKVKEGRIELQGAMWVEPDLNVSGEESLVRQIMVGNRFWKEEFGQEIHTAHIPDVFGFNAALPQIMKKSGVDNLLTIKMSWNTYNMFPYHTFNWQGIDGSEVLVHMPPEGTYNSSCAPRAIRFAEKNYIDKGVCDEAVILYGIGDGGGGPSTEHLESLKRIENLSGISPVKSGMTKDFFERIQKNRKAYATYKGEMYLEKHQGTYTTQARNKYFNRKIERLLFDAELLSTMAFHYKHAAYPKDKLDAIWKEILLYQFHDILPGSSIKRVYDESVARYEILVEELNTIIQNALHCFEQDKKYQFIPLQFKSVAVEEKRGKASNYTENTMENDYVRVQFNENGEMVSIYDKQLDKEMLAGTSNVLAVYEDNGDCWDMEANYLSKPRGKFMLDSYTIERDGDCVIRKNRYTYNLSKLEQRIILKPNSRIIDIQTHADWRESYRFLKAEFVPNIHSDFVNCNIQFGNLKRSTKKNTPYELAQIEICAHKYLDMSEGNDGFALLNNCKYGYTVDGNNIQMSLLRSPNNPGENADKGEHEFHYAIYSHDGCFEQSDVVEKAYEYNGNVYPGFKLPQFISIQSDSVIIESVKKAEDSDAIIVRAYESKGCSADCVMVPQFDFRKVQECGLNEVAFQPIEVQSGAMHLKFKPFEIRTFLFE